MVAFPPGFVLSDGPTYLGLVDDLYPRTDRHRRLRLPAGGADRCVPRRLAGHRSPARARAPHRRAALRPAAARGRCPAVWRPSPACRCCSTRCSWRWSTRRSATCSSTCWSWPAIAALAWHRQPGLADGRARRPAARARRVRPRRRPAARRRRRAVLPVGRDDLARASAAPRWWSRCRSRSRSTAYAAWYHAEHGVWALTESGGRALYMRTTGFVDCSTFTMPAYERPLCPAEPLGLPPGPDRLRLAHPRRHPRPGAAARRHATTRRWATSRSGRSAPSPARTRGSSPAT